MTAAATNHTFLRSGVLKGMHRLESTLWQPGCGRREAGAVFPAQFSGAAAATRRQRGTDGEEIYMQRSRVEYTGDVHGSVGCNKDDLPCIRERVRASVQSDLPPVACPTVASWLPELPGRRDEQPRTDGCRAPEARHTATYERETGPERPGWPRSRVPALPPTLAARGTFSVRYTTPGTA